MIAARSGYTRQLNSRYATYGQNATFTNPKDGKQAALRMVDLTKGVEVGGGESQMATVLPSITARSSDLKGLGLKPTDLIGVDISISSETWGVVSFAPHPSPWGQEFGEIYFVVEASNG